MLPREAASVAVAAGDRYSMVEAMGIAPNAGKESVRLSDSFPLLTSISTLPFGKRASTFSRRDALANRIVA